MAVYTAPLAIIKMDGVEIGTARNIRCNESYQRGRVTGIGSANAKELPLLAFSGTVSIGFYNINFKKHPSFNPDALALAAGETGFNRQVDNSQNLLNALLLQEKGFDLMLMQKVKKSIDPITKIITMDTVEYVTVRNLFITADNFDVSEGQISGRDSNFEYTDPIVYQAPR